MGAYYGGELSLIFIHGEQTHENCYKHVLDVLKALAAARLEGATHARFKARQTGQGILNLPINRFRTEQTVAYLKRTYRRRSCFPDTRWFRTRARSNGRPLRNVGPCHSGRSRRSTARSWPTGTQTRSRLGTRPCIALVKTHAQSCVRGRAVRNP